MAEITPEKIAELRGLWKKATTGPWRRRGRGSPHIDIVADAKGDDNPLLTLHEAGACGTMAERHAEAVANAALIVSMKNTLPDLLSAIEADRARLAKMGEALGGLSRLLLPIHMILAEHEMTDEPLPDDAVILHFMGSGASDQVSAGEFRAATEIARQALADPSPDKGQR